MTFRSLIVLLMLSAVGLAAEPRRVTTDGGFKQHLHFTPDGKRLVFTRLHQGQMAVWTVAADGSDLKPLLPQWTTPHFDGHPSPDSKRIVFVYDILQGTDGKLQINTVNLDGSENRNLIPHKAFEESPRWSPDGKSVLWVSTRDGNQELYVTDLDGKKVERLTSEVTADNQPSWSPDGKRIAFVSGRTGDQEVFVMTRDGKDVTRLTDNKGLDCWPSWSPDGKRIAFTTNRDGHYEVYVMNADGSEPRNVSTHAGHDNFAAWSPDGKSLAFISNRGGGYDIYITEMK